MKMFNAIKQLGIGLLELMLSLAIIAILLIMATRYYQSASNSENINSAVDMINAVKSATKAYMASGATTLPTVADLVSAGYLPSMYSDSTTAGPWSNEICISGGTSSGTTPSISSCSSSTTTVGTTFEVIMDNVPSGSCGEISGRLANTINTGLGELAYCPSTADSGKTVSFAAVYQL